MANVRFLGVHRTWEDYLGGLLGILIVFSPLVAELPMGSAVLINAGAVGVFVLALAAFELVDLHRWEEYLEIVCGLWLIASPFLFGYTDAVTLMIWQLVLGVAVALLAGYELWQDWDLSDSDLSRHGH